VPHRAARELDPALAALASTEPGPVASSRIAPSGGRKAVPGSAAAGERVRGRVLGPDGAPLPGAHIELVLAPFSGFALLVEEFRRCEQHVAETQSGTDGSFVLDAPAGASLRVRASAPGLATEERADVHAGDEIELVLELPGRLAVEAGGDAGPCAGALVELLRQGSAGTAWTGKTDVAGRAEARGLEPGIFTVECTPVEGTRTFVLDVPVAPGGVATVPLRIEAGSELSGCVRAARDGRPLSTARDAVRVTGSRTCAVETDARGEFRLRGLPAGFPEWTVAVTATGHAPAEIRVRADAPPVLSIELAPELRLAGTVQDAGGHPVRDAWIACGTAGARSDAEGRFELAGLRPLDAHVVVVRALGHATRGVLSRGREGETRRELGRITLERPASLTGRVRTTTGRTLDGAGVELQLLTRPSSGEGSRPGDTATIVVARAATSSGALPVSTELERELELAGRRDARTNATGLFRVDDLEPGRYRVVARKNGYRATQPVEVDVPGGGQGAELELVLDEGASLSGTVSGSDGVPLANAWLVLRGSGLPSGGPVQLSDLEGRFTLHGVPRGVVALEASYHRYDANGEPLYLRREVQDLVAPRADLALVLPRNRPIEGRVVDEAGRALVGYEVRSTDADGRVLTAPTDEEGRFRVGAADGVFVELELAGPARRDPEEAARAATRPAYEARLEAIAAGSTGIELIARPRS
jgi:protocatechuate 3,4-dioxygenase beta subunit